MIPLNFPKHTFTALTSHNGWLTFKRVTPQEVAGEIYYHVDGNRMYAYYGINPQQPCDNPSLTISITPEGQLTSLSYYSEKGGSPKLEDGLSILSEMEKNVPVVLKAIISSAYKFAPEPIPLVKV